MTGEINEYNESPFFALVEEPEGYMSGNTTSLMTTHTAGTTLDGLYAEQILGHEPARVALAVSDSLEGDLSLDFAQNELVHWDAPKPDRPTWIGPGKTQ